MRRCRGHRRPQISRETRACSCSTARACSVVRLAHYGQLILERLASQMNATDSSLREWLHFSGRQLDAALQHRVHFGSTHAQLAARAGAAQEYGALRTVQAILDPSLPLEPAPARLADETLRRFRILQRRHPAELLLTNFTSAIAGPEVQGKGIGSAMFESPRQETTVQRYGDDPRGRAVAWVWQLLGLRDRDRLKRCARCTTWFVDRMRSKRKVWCSSECHDAAWRRAERRKAAHAQYRKRRPAKGRRGGRR